MIKSEGKVSTPGLMVDPMMVNGNEISLTDRESSFLKMEQYMMDNGETTFDMDLGSKQHQMERPMKADLKRANNTVLE